MPVTYNSFGITTTNRNGYDFAISLTPSNTLQDGIAPSGFVIASYLPIQRFDQEKFTHVVISSGKPCALDSKGAVVPAGFKLELDAYVAAGGNPGGDATATLKYTQLDVTNKVKNFKGALVTVGEPVVKSFVTGASTIDNSISYYQGVAPNDFYIHAGGNNLTAATLNYTNFNIQPVVTLLMDYHMQYPMVASLALARTAPLAGIACLVAAPTEIKPGSFITYDKESNFVVAGTGPDIYGYGVTKPEAILGQVSAITVYKDPAGNVVKSHNFLETVVAPNMATASVLNQLANANNGGMGSYITYSNGYGIVNFGLISR